MNSRTIVLALGGALLMTLGGSQATFACLCCAEAGQRLERIEPLNADQRKELSKLRFAKTAAFFADSAFPENVRGVIDPDDRDYRLQVEMLPQRLTFTLTGKDNRTGRIAFTMPAQVERLETDPRVRIVNSKGGGISLYKEWKFNGDAELSGFVAAGEKRTLARLVLQGLGNGCTWGEDFSHWMLLVETPKTKFSLLGTLDSSTTGPNDLPRP